MATAVHPRPTSTAGLSSSQSQNSAPVFEYRCMFTHDVRKKAKKWHDGSLRFHTFNKRVMVYDDSKNLVGSLHYRSHEDFVEGLELNLDSHVLVQVEEKLSESSTDLTPLLSRQKQDGADNFVKPDPPTRATLARINAANSQIKPKSIKELLAGSQGMIGRARLPNKSPYEERHPLAESQPPEPEPEPELKRRKIIHDKENNVDIAQGIQPLTKKRTSLVHAQPTSSSRIIDISSDDELALLPEGGEDTRRIQQISSGSTVLPPNTTSTAKRSLKLPVSAEPKRQKRNQQIRPELPIPQPKENVLKKPKKTRREPDDNPARPLSASPTIPKTSTANPSTSEVRHATGPRSSLKFAAEKSRPKLMYRALLADSSKPASDFHSTAATSDSANNASSDPSRDNEQLSRRPRPTNVIDTDKLFAPSQIGRDISIAAVAAEPSHSSSPPDGSLSPDPMRNKIARPSLELTHLSVGNSALDKEITETVPDSPLFLPRTISQISPLPSQDLAIDDSHVSFLSQALKDTTSKRSFSPANGTISAIQSSAGIDSSRQSPEPPSSPVFQKLLSADSRPEKPIPIPNPLRADETRSCVSAPSPPMTKTLSSLPPALPAQVRLFRRVVSENVQPVGMSPETSAGNSYTGDDSFNSLPEDDMPGKGLMGVENLPVQSHSFSDPVEIRLVSPVPHSALSSPDVDNDTQRMGVDDATNQIPEVVDTTTAYIPIEESGPWTSTEAFLLFDWWPPGREKPPYAANTSTAANELDRDVARKGQSITTNPMSKKKYGTFGSAKFVSQR